MAAELGITGETLRTWVRKDNTGQQAPVTRDGSGSESPTEGLTRLRDEDRRGLTALFWSTVNPYGTFRLGMDKRLDPGSAIAVPRPRPPTHQAARSTSKSR